MEENIDGGVDPGDFPVFPEPNIEFPPYVPTPPPVNSLCREMGTGAYSLYPDQTLIIPSSNEAENTAKIYYPCEIRSSGSFPTSLRIYGGLQLFDGVSWYYNDADFWSCDAIDSGGNILANGAISGSFSSYYNVTFQVGDYTDIWGFRIRITKDPTGGYAPGDTIAFATAQAQNGEAGVSLSGMTIGQVYCIQGYGGPWYSPFNEPPYSPGPFYDFAVSKDLTNFSGQLGLITTYDNKLILKLDTPSGCLYSERVGGTRYARTYFEATATSIKFRADDNFSSGETLTGSISASLKETVPFENCRFNINGLSLYNICPVGGG